MKEWPKRVATVPDYDCTITFYDPTIAELDAIEQARKEGNDAKVREIISGLIISWDATGKDGQPKDKTAEGLAELPPVFTGTIVDGIVNNVGRKSGDPKGSACESSPTTQQLPEGIKSEIPLLKQ